MNKIEQYKIGKITHHGFAEITPNKINEFLSNYNVPFSPEYYLNNDMVNPLFLSWFCQVYRGREEDLLINSGHTNWTIIRPYITFNKYRLQLGVFEKEQWLWRMLNGRTAIVPADILNRYTSLTYGDDVARTLIGLLHNPKSYGQIFHIVTDKAYKWKDILTLYVDVVRRVKSFEPKYKIISDSKGLCNVWNKWQILYDRLYDRKFDNNKVFQIGGKVEYTDSLSGLEMCLTAFLKDPKWLNINPRIEAWSDRQTHEFTPLKQIQGFKNKLRYIKYRFFVK